MDLSKFSGFDAFYQKHSPTATYQALKISEDQKGPNSKGTSKTIEAAMEVTIALIINDRYRLNLLVTPMQLEALAVGYVMTEGLIKSFREIISVQYREKDQIRVYTTNPGEDFFYWTEVRTSGCTGIQQQYDKLAIHLPIAWQIRAEILFSAQEIMNRSGVIWQKSGGTHMSALFRRDGKLVCVAEDVGRHNTLDKIIGQALIEGLDLSQHFITTSGRLSAAMIAKIARAGVPLIVSYSAPLSEGIELAKKCGITLIGFARRPAYNIYTGSERIEM